MSQARFRNYQPLADYAKLKKGVMVKCKDVHNFVYPCTIVGKADTSTFWEVMRNGETFLIDLDEITEILEEIPGKKEESVGNNRREGVKAEAQAPPAKQEVPAKQAITADVVIAAYIKTRDAIEAEKKIFDEKVEKLKAVQAKREQWLTSKLDELKLTNFKAAGVGIAFFKNRTSATIADATQFVAWVKEDWEERNHFLEKRVSKTAVDESVKDGHTPPPGTSYSTTRVVQINHG